jgi:DNA-binding transcriptional regulator YiaG
MDAAHSCGKGHEGCVNPAHLRWDTRSGNFSDKLAHGTDNRGEKSPVSKLTESDVIKIREMRGTVSQSQLAKMFNIDQSNVSKIQSGHSWSWL